MEVNTATTETISTKLTVFHQYGVKYKVSKQDNDEQ